VYSAEALSRRTSMSERKRPSGGRIWMSEGERER